MYANWARIHLCLNVTGRKYSRKQNNYVYKRGSSQLRSAPSATKPRFGIACVRGGGAGGIGGGGILHGGSKSLQDLPDFAIDLNEFMQHSRNDLSSIRITCNFHKIVSCLEQPYPQQHLSWPPGYVWQFDPPPAKKKKTKNWKIKTWNRSKEQFYAGMVLKYNDAIAS